MGLLERIMKRHGKKLKDREEYIKHQAEFIKLMDEMEMTCKKEARRCEDNAMNTTDATDALRWTETAEYWHGRARLHRQAGTRARLRGYY